MPRWAAGAAAILVTAGVSLVYEYATASLTATTMPALVGFYGGTAAVIIGFAVWQAHELALPSFLVCDAGTVGSKFVRWLVFGIGMGVVLALASFALADEGAAALRPWFWRRIQTFGDAALLSARAAVLEESFFRLFLIPFLVSVILRMRPTRFRLDMRDGAAHAVIDRPSATPTLTVVAVVVSSLMFGLAHPFNPGQAILLAPLLAASYLKGGWESAVTAHFVADFIVFSRYF